MAKRYDKEALIADHKTGVYSQRELAKKYNISVGTVNGHTQGVEQETKQLVQKKVEVNQLSGGLSKHELNAVDIAVQFKVNFLRDVQKFGNQALKKAVELMDVEVSGHGFKAIVDGVDKLTVTNGLNPRFATTAQIEINNATQANLSAGALPDNPIDAARTYQEFIGK